MKQRDTKKRITCFIFSYKISFQTIYFVGLKFNHFNFVIKYTFDMFFGDTNSCVCI